MTLLDLLLHYYISPTLSLPGRPGPYNVCLCTCTCGVRPLVFTFWGRLTTWLRPTKLDLAYPLRVVPTLVYGIVPVGNNVGPVSIGWAIGPSKSVGPIQSNLVAA